MHERISAFDGAWRAEVSRQGRGGNPPSRARIILVTPAMNRYEINS